MSKETQPRSVYSGASEQERAIALHRPELLSLLEMSSLSDDDKQQLRKLSADFVVATTSLPEDATDMRNTILTMLSSDLPEFGRDDMTGLQRALSSKYPTVILIDGKPLSRVELEVMYTAIKPTPEALPGAESSRFLDAAGVGTAMASRAVSTELAMTNTLSFVAEAEPEIETSHTFKDELRPITAQAMKLTSKVLEFIGVGSR